MNKVEEHYRLIVRAVEELHLLVQLDRKMIERLEGIRALKISYLLGRMQKLSLDRCVLLVTVLLDQRASGKYETVSIPLFIKYLRTTNCVSESTVKRVNEIGSELSEIYHACKYFRNKFIAHLENEKIDIIEKHKLGFCEFAKAAEGLSDVCDLICSEVFSKEWTVTRVFDHVAEFQELMKIEI